MWESAETGRLLRIGAENGGANASLVSRVENWVEVDVAPARISDVLPGAFDRWEVYDASGRPVSPGGVTCETGEKPGGEAHFGAAENARDRKGESHA